MSQKHGHLFAKAVPDVALKRCTAARVLSVSYGKNLHHPCHIGQPAALGFPDGGPVTGANIRKRMSKNGEILREELKGSLRAPLSRV